MLRLKTEREVVMNLSSSLQAKLDAPTKAFEVALRCFVADNILSQYSDEQSLKDEIQKRIDSIKGTHIILSGKITSSNILSAREWSSFWENICFSQDCYYKKEHFKSHDVAFLSQTILMTYVFQDLHQPFIQAFGKPENYLFYAQKYYDVRNALSHQGSSVISDEDAKSCVFFMKKGCKCINEPYFWFRSAVEIERDIDNFEKALYLAEPIIENLDMVPFSSNCIVCREPELTDLFKYVCGWNGTKRLRNRKHLVCISGYGGIGKTSLVTEFLSRLLELMKSESYGGLRPTFILFYSAKIQTMEFDQSFGSLYIRKTRSQFSNCDQLLSCFYNDLSIEEFDDEWEQQGIFIVDNLETLDGEERRKIIDFINDVLPSSVQVIITTRIPEHADEQMQLRGFQNEAGLHFIEEYLSKNKINLTLSDKQRRDLIKYSYGNSLVLVLALKRLGAQKSSYRSIISELQRLPKNDTDNSISHFMFQNTIEEILKIYPENRETTKSVLICLSLRPEALTADVLASAHRGTSITVDEIEDILQLLTRYLIVEKIGDTYVINEFANHFILTSMTPSQETKREWESKLLSAMHETEQQKMTVDELKENYPKLSGVLEEWKGEREEESLAICHAFSIYDRKKAISCGNAAFEIDQLNREFDQIEYQYSTHPYIYYQRARILKELRSDKIIEDEYNDLIKSNYEKCLMMIDTPSFVQIKATQTYPSVLWIYSMFLLSISCFEEASRYAYDAVQNYKQLGIVSADADDALFVYGIAEINLFKLDLNMQHLKNAREALSKSRVKKNMKKNVQKHYDQLASEVNKYNRFAI